MIREYFILFLGLLFVTPSIGQVCTADAGQDTVVCGGKKSGSNYRVYLDGTGSSVSGGEINYKWTALDDGISFSSSQSKKAEPYFNYPQDLTEDTAFRIELRVYDDDEICEDFDTLDVTCQANMCPIPDVGDGLVRSNGCDVSVALDGTESEDPDNEQLYYQWESMDGNTANLFDPDSSIATFVFPEIYADQEFTFKMTVNDGENFVQDTLVVTYLDNDAPIADAGNDFITCQATFTLKGDRSYDLNWNELSYQWTLLDGSLSLNLSSSGELTVTSPVDLDLDTDYRFELRVNDGYCEGVDTVTVTIQDNLCPIADAGGTVRVPKFENRTVTLNASASYDPEGDELIYLWTAPDGSTSSDSTVLVNDLTAGQQDSYARYRYDLRVTDNGGATAEDYVEVIFSDFSAPRSPQVFAVADHNRILVSWDASSEASIDSLTGYADFEGYKLYRSTDSGTTWGGAEDKLYDFDGNFVGWIPYAQFDLSYDEDVDHCIYTHELCESDDLRRNISIYGLDPLAPRFSFGENSGIQYSFVDSNVVDGVEYTYTVTAYDIGIEPFTVLFTETDSGGVYVADTVWSTTNPDKFLGPDTLLYYDVNGDLVRIQPNPERGYPYLESDKGTAAADKNLITVIPGYTASNVSFPDEKDIEAIFRSDENNIGTGERAYFIVDRKEIVADKLLMYEIQAEQGSQAVDGLACENPYLYVYEIGDTLDRTPKYSIDYLLDGLDFFQTDSLTGLPGSMISSSIVSVPEYQLISPVGKWSDMMDGIRFKYENIIPLNPLSAPELELSSMDWYDENGVPLDSISLVRLIFSGLYFDMAYTNLNSYLRRLNFDYQIEFFSGPVGDSIEVSGINGTGMLGLPYRITNLWTGKKVSVGTADWGNENSNPLDEENGAGDFSWTRNEEIFMNGDTLSIGGELAATYNFNLKINFDIPNYLKTAIAWDPTIPYTENDTVFYKQMLWGSAGYSEGLEPSAIFVDDDNDGVNDNTWRPWYPWDGGETVVIRPHKFFVDGDNWVSDMSVLGAVSDIVDTTLQEIKVVPNPYVVRSIFNETPDSRKIRFTHLPQECRILIFTITGEVIKKLEHDDQFDGNEWWDLRTENNQELSPGLYIYYVESKNGLEHIGKFAVIR